jgi:glycosyltransferase involved in cell wall biosynthesis
MQLSVIIPTCNRPAALLRQLQSLQAQTRPADELVVVDNAPSVTLRRALATFNATAPHPAYYIPEPCLGLMEARHTGAIVATGDVLVYVDDDQTSVPGHVQAYAEAFAAHPTMAAAGGPVHLDAAVPVPHWLTRVMAPPLRATGMFPPLSLLERGPDFLLEPTGVIFGGNMAIRRAVLFQVGGFNPELIGSRCVGDGETGLNQKLWQIGALIGYVPGALQYHHLPAERLTLDALCQRMRQQGASDAYSAVHPHLPSRLRLLRHLVGMSGRYGRCWLHAWQVRGSTEAHHVRVQLLAACSQAKVGYLARLLWERELRELVQRERWLDVGGSDCASTEPRPGGA